MDDAGSMGQRQGGVRGRTLRLDPLAQRAATAAERSCIWGNKSFFAFLAKHFTFRIWDDLS